jgi:hypothetical protein
MTFFMNTAHCLVLIWMLIGMPALLKSEGLSCIRIPKKGPSREAYPLLPGISPVHNPPGRHKLRRLPATNPQQSGNDHVAPGRSPPAKEASHTHDFYTRNIKHKNK